MTEKDCICKVANNPITGIADALYCEKHNIYWLKISGTLSASCILDTPQLLDEHNVPGMPQYSKFKLSIDTNETKHKNIPHFHIYYGEARSVGYSIETLQPLENEKNLELLQMKKRVSAYLKILGKWIDKPSNIQPELTNREYMLQQYDYVVRSQENF